jgi:hypothetical protein
MEPKKEELKDKPIPQKEEEPKTPTKEALKPNLILPPALNPYLFNLATQNKTKPSPKIAPSIDKSILFSQKFPLPSDINLTKKRKIENSTDKGCNCKKTGFHFFELTIKQVV